ncbi:MAG: cytochrome c biogenesis protein CcsA [Deltaproteobacteria bacterium]|nr:cytochrome c biogenesis protein CcsA [Deltaproteobacteria bacterium]
MSRFALEVTLHWTAVGLYIVATLFFALATLLDRPHRTRWGVWAALAGLVPHSAAIVVRWVASGHGPYMLRHEVLSSNAWVAVLAVALFLWRRPGWSAMGLVVVPVAFLAMAVGVFTNLEIRELPPTLRSVWLVFHISFAKLSTGGFLLSLGSAVVLLWKGRVSHPQALQRLPEADALDAYIARFAGFGFVFWTISIAAGSIWANQSWGRYWGWDPIETWSLVTWLCYGSFLHARLFFRLRGTTAAWGSVACFSVAVLTIFALPFLMPSIHAAYFQ